MDELVARAQLLQIQNQAEVAAQAGNYAGAAMLFDSANLDFATRGVVGVAAASRSLRSKYTDHQVYAASAGSRMGMNRGLNRARAASALADDDVKCLEFMGISDTTDAQESLMRSFKEEPQVGDVDVQPGVVINPSMGNIFGNPPGTDGLATPKVEESVKTTLSKRRSNQW